MGFVSLTVDADMDDIQTSVLVEEICRRLVGGLGVGNYLFSYEREKLKKALNALNNALSITPIMDIEIKTLEDQMKYEHFVKIFHKYRSSDIERLLPE